MSVKITGDERFRRRLDRLIERAESIELAAAHAGCATMLREINRTVPRGTQADTGYRVQMVAGKAVGRVGIMRFPVRGQKRGPILAFPDQGTKFIAPRHWVARALATSRPRAIAAMRAAAERKIRSIAKP